jgi:hypothetical protein
MRWGCGGELVDGLASIRGCFDRRVPTVIPALLLKMSASKGRASCFRNGEVESLRLPLRLCPPLPHPPLRSQVWRGVSSP